MSRKRVVGLVLAGAVVAVFAFGLSRQDEVARVGDARVVVPPSGFQVFDAAPIAGSTLSGDAFSLASLRGRPAFITFWQTACVPCEREAPDLRAFAAGLGQRAAIVGIVMDSRASDARGFARKHGWRFPSVSKRCCELNDRYGVIGYPTTIVIDGEGRVVDRLPGAQTLERLRAELRAL
jgi:peroxiredoxin